MNSFQFLIGFLRVITARYVMINPYSNFDLYEEVNQDKIFKLMYESTGKVKISIYDQTNSLINTLDKPRGQIYTKIRKNMSFNTDTGLPSMIKITFTNYDDKSIKLSFKMPEAEKELPTSLGYAKDTDLVVKLQGVLDKLIVDQLSYLDRVKAHYGMVKKFRGWSKILCATEIIFIFVAITLLYLDFVSMFETRTKV
ncbi:hypothetical protein A0H76_2229 [Hepatospora eriocheir]|uniref:GOLD domain-containing protein n=1 Tax=Hepatospora eriocheir TaxID=1081669 RepID=A0A1X0QFK8_9MICR|nr:hypothetical protein A0H76_2229 [Hepatospora eriocheir]